VQYTLTRWNLNTNGCCNKCGTRCSGIFDAAPGTWGSRRLPVRLKDFALSVD
jgi:pyruvate formate lyase activating enzyme